LSQDHFERLHVAILHLHVQPNITTDELQCVQGCPEPEIRRDLPLPPPTSAEGVATNPMEVGISADEAGGVMVGDQVEADPGGCLVEESEPQFQVVNLGRA
jgi:hypothetical protein